MRDERRPGSLAGIVLPDARTGVPVVLAELAGIRVLTLLRHRY